MSLRPQPPSVTAAPTARFDPIAKASSLLAQLGHDKAVTNAMDEIQKAHANNDNYALSLWREVRQALKTELK
jgi:hypothetical protein